MRTSDAVESYLGCRTPKTLLFGETSALRRGKKVRREDQKGVHLALMAVKGQGEGRKRTSDAVLGGAGLRLGRLLPRQLFANMPELGVARRPVDMNKVAGIDSPMVNDARRFEVVERITKRGTKTRQRSCAASASVADNCNARGKILRMAFKPKLQPPRQILLAQVLPRRPIVECVARRHEKGDETRIQAVRPMAFVRNFAVILQSVVDQMPKIFKLFRLDDNGTLEQALKIGSKLFMLALARAPAKNAQDCVRRNNNSFAERSP